MMDFGICALSSQRKYKMSEDYYSNILGSGAANVASALVFLLIWVVRNKCKHFKCNSHTSCCDIEIKDDDAEQPEERHEIRSKHGTCRFSGETQESLQEMFACFNSRVLQKRETIIQID